MTRVSSFHSSFFSRALSITRGARASVFSTSRAAFSVVTAVTVSSTWSGCIADCEGRIVRERSIRETDL